MKQKIKDKNNNNRRGLRAKMVLSITSIAAVLLIACVISVMEYNRMSSTVADLVIREAVAEVPSFKPHAYPSAHSGALTGGQAPDSMSLAPAADSARLVSIADSLAKSYSEHFHEAHLREREVLKDYVSGLYRSIIPGIVAVAVGILLLLMLLFFILTYYVNPLYKMLDGMNGYRSYNKSYNVPFDGDDQLSELNDGISEIINENQQLRARIQAIRNRQTKDGEE